MKPRSLPVAKVTDLEDGRTKVVQVDDYRIAICKVGSEVFAIEDVCTHDYGPLGGGRLDGHAIECPRHGARFDVRDGKVLRMPAAAGVKTFPVHEKDGQIYVEIE